MLKLLHISDLHFGPTYLPLVGEALLRAAATARPDVIVASGDFTQRAKSAQFAEARAFLNRMPPAPVVVVPGNHDVPLYRILERAFQPYMHYRQHICDQLDTVLKRDDAVIVALNTTSAWTKVVNGRIQNWQLDLCADAFRDAPPGAARIVVAHHHFAPAPDYADAHDVMRRAQQALDRFSDLKVDLILGGHLHRAYIGNSLDVCPSKNRESGIIIVHSGTSTSRRGRARERAKNSFNIIQIDTEQVRVEHQMFFHQLGGFAPVSRHVFPRRDKWFLSSDMAQPPG